jgi:hypothetical protein
MSTARPPYVPTRADIERRLRELAPHLADRLSPRISEQPEDAYLEDSNSDEDNPIAPPTLAPAALHGLAGDIVRSLAPHTEADPAALLLQLLALYGNLAGPAPHALVGPTRHGLNLFVVLVGDSSKARKGTSWRQIEALFSGVDPDWAADRIINAPPTSAGIFECLRDRQEPSDRRLVLLAEEFASLLYCLGRKAGQLSSLLRSAWDGGNLSGTDGHHHVQATAAHISLIGHIHQSDLARHLGRNEIQNGFANRCLWAGVRRSQVLPNGGSLPAEQLSAYVRELSRAVQWLTNQPELIFHRTQDADALWNDSYPALSQSRPDVYGAATSRAEAQVLRLSAIYAALDATASIETCHLQAALAVWNYCQESARLFFDGAPIDAVARRINEAIVTSGAGLSKNQIRTLFHGHISGERIDLALEQLMALGLIGRPVQATGTGRGRRATLWVTENDEGAN